MFIDSWVCRRQLMISKKRVFVKNSQQPSRPQSWGINSTFIITSLRREGIRTSKIHIYRGAAAAVVVWKGSLWCLFCENRKLPQKSRKHKFHEKKIYLSKYWSEQRGHTDKWIHTEICSGALWRNKAKSASCGGKVEKANWIYVFSMCTHIN